jgi:hypothetical protein
VLNTDEQLADATTGAQALVEYQELGDQTVEAESTEKTETAEKSETAEKTIEA